MNRTLGKRLEKTPYPTLDQMETEIARRKYRKRFSSALRGTVYSLAVVAAIAVLVATLWMPVLRITGTSMEPTLADGQFAAAIKTTQLNPGELCVFYFNNKLLVKRVIACAGSWVDMDLSGNVYVDGILLEEPYLTEKSLGECTIELPFQVPDGKLFVMGDDRAVSLDSRTTVVGCISREQILGRVVFRLWQLDVAGVIA